MIRSTAQPQTLILAGRETTARDAANDANVAWRDAMYVSRASILRGINTGGAPRIIAPDFHARRDANQILAALTISDLHPAPGVATIEPTA